MLGSLTLCGVAVGNIIGIAELSNFLSLANFRSRSVRKPYLSRSSVFESHRARSRA